MKKKIKYSVEDLKQTSSADFGELLEKYDVTIYMYTPRKAEKNICLAVLECDKWTEDMPLNRFTDFSRGSKAVFQNELKRFPAVKLTGAHYKKVGFIIPIK